MALYGKTVNIHSEEASMKKLIAVAIAVVFMVGAGLSAAVAADAPKGPIKVTNFGGKDAVTFDHAKHKVDCETCHHNAKEGKFKCGDCHKGEAGKAPAMKDAAHEKEKGKCWGCHNKASANVKKELKCADCHKG